MEENGRYKLSVENRLTKVETTLAEVVDNHLPHLQVSVEKVDIRMQALERKLAYYAGVIVAITFLGNIIIKTYLP